MPKYSTLHRFGAKKRKKVFFFYTKKEIGSSKAAAKEEEVSWLFIIECDYYSFIELTDICC